MELQTWNQKMVACKEEGYENLNVINVTLNEKMRMVKGYGVPGGDLQMQELGVKQIWTTRCRWIWDVLLQNIVENNLNWTETRSNEYILKEINPEYIF